MKHVYTELDCLIDTRFTTAIKLDPIGLARDIKNNKYYTRLTNCIGDIPIDIFNYVYKHRNKHILKLSNPTLLANFILEYFKEESTLPDSKESRDRNKLFVNCYPYDLTDNEKYYLSCMFTSKFPFTEIILVSYPNDKLTPKWMLSREIDLIIKYDGLMWLDYHILMGNFINDPLNLISLVVPKLIDNTDSLLLVENIENKFNFIKEMMVMFIDITFAPVSIFSLINPENIDKLNETESIVKDDISKADLLLKEEIEKKFSKNKMSYGTL